MKQHKIARRKMVFGAVASTVTGHAAKAQPRTDTAPPLLNGQAVPEPSPEKSAGPVTPGRRSALNGKSAVVTGAAGDRPGHRR